MFDTKVAKTSSYVEIWKYDKPVSQNELVSQKEKKSAKRKSFEELTPTEKQKQLSRLKKHRQEAKWRLLRLIDTNFDLKTSFITLTTKENIQDRDQFNKLFMQFVKRYNYWVFQTKTAQLKYVACLERQKRGSWHAHCLFFDVPFVPHKELSRIWKQGAVRINKLNELDDVANAGRYCVKYMEKGIGQELLESLGKKSYLHSNNLKSPIEFRYLSGKPLVVDPSLVAFETEYDSKVFFKHELISNPVHYFKIPIHQANQEAVKKLLSNRSFENLNIEDRVYN
ncbi:rolling circle replication-associated protein [Oenococcus kitaharae]|uniref:Rep protein n=1 Tax=Oenococcus kitaharae DSM 17330 TaxID=1045004 RepID=G9WJV2_9LACO|nr:hypothetical protein [Oenococcus kitaharae]EHN58120.1 Rep protein [Oenococcus kitaharae DSM 17330]